MDPKTEIYSSLSKLKWATESLSLVQLIESLEMPQICKIAKSNSPDIHEDEYFLLQSVYDRYVMLGSSQQSNQQNNNYLIPDWYRANCKIRSPNPIIQKQFWNFQGASEISRFDLPREINFLVETPIYQFSSKNGNKNEWKKVVLKRNTKLVVTKTQNYSVENVNRGSCFILSDRKGTKFLLPSEFNIKFSVEIKQEEYNSTYFDNKGLFSLPEVITRYALPVEIEFSPSTEPGSIPESKLLKTPLKLVSVAIAKSIVGSLFDEKAKKFRYMELSPATQIKVSIPTCLQHGLLNPNVTLTKEEENEYNFYNKTREAALALCHKNCELFKFDMRIASNEEKESMTKIYESGIKFKKDELTKLKDDYLLDIKSQDAANPDAKIPFISLKNIFLRPNIDEGDPYDDITQDGDSEKISTFTHDLTLYSQMPDKLLTDSINLSAENAKNTSKS